MFNFFANLALAVYYGQWLGVQQYPLVTGFINYLKKVPIFGLFNNSTEAFYDTTGFVTVGSIRGDVQLPGLAITISVILSTICCIGVFWMIVNAIRKLFTVFLEWF